MPTTSDPLRFVDGHPQSWLTSVGSAHLHDQSGPGDKSTGHSRGMTAAQQGTEEALQENVAPAPEEPMTRPSIQTARVQCPALRQETLTRPRLLNWLHTSTQRRAVLITAEAGFGKTTLLADFSRRTRLRVAWYRVEHSDRDWRVVVRYLVAAVREVAPAFGEATLSHLDRAERKASRDEVLATLVGELDAPSVAELMLVIDDFHLIDDDADCRSVVGQLVDKAPDRFCVVIASRRASPLGFGRLRAAGDVSDLTTDDLRFDVSETAQLLVDAHGQALDADVVDTLSRRTEGWIASIQLVQTALRNRSKSEARTFVRSLHGGSRVLHDYLAEVVVGELDGDLQEFLMATSVLQVVTPDLAEVVSRLNQSEAHRMMIAAERLALLARVSGESGHQRRYHPLVREFLTARLESVHGVGHVADLHRAVASSLPVAEWATAAHHYREAGDPDAVLSTIAAAIPAIMANGQYSLAESFIQGSGSQGRTTSTELVIGRLGLQYGDYDGAARSALAVLHGSGTDRVQRDHALMNLLAVDFNYGRGEQALALATALLDGTEDENLRAIAEATSLILTLSSEKDLEVLNGKLKSMAGDQRSDRTHHFGVSMYNLAANSLAQDRPYEAQREIEQALRAFDHTSSHMERQAAEALRIAVLLRVGMVEAAETALADTLARNHPLPNDSILEAADAFDAFGRQDVASRLIDMLGDSSSFTVADQRLYAITFARRHLRRQDVDGALRAMCSYPDGVPTAVGMQAWKEVVAAQIEFQAGRDCAGQLLSEAAARAGQAGIHSARRFAELLLATRRGGPAVAEVLASFGTTHPWQATWAADHLMPLLNEPEVEVVATIAASTHPASWRPHLRTQISASSAATLASALGAARVLEVIGEKPDVARLRAFSKLHKRVRSASDLGRTLARRVAVRVYVEDQGRVQIRVGNRVIDGSTIRRKVLALLCFLLSRPDYSATKDQVLDALWPDLDPATAVNSLNQTLYFLRRVLEEDYEEDLTPGFAMYQGDVIWLDPELVTSRSTDCHRAMRLMSTTSSPDEVAEISNLYRGRFALDFEYEEWAGTYREFLHAEYLEIVERSIRTDVETGHLDRAISIARRALEADPRSDWIEVTLVRLLQTTGAHSAAAEQYIHYASAYRDELGLEPPPLDSLEGIGKVPY